MDAVQHKTKVDRLLTYKKVVKRQSKQALTHINPNYKSKTKKLQIISDKVIKARPIQQKQTLLKNINKAEQKTHQVVGAAQTVTAK